MKTPVFLLLLATAFCSFCACHKDPRPQTVDPQALAYAEGHYRRYYYTFKDNGGYVVPELEEEFARLNLQSDAVRLALPPFELEGLVIAADSVLILSQIVPDKTSGKTVVVRGSAHWSGPRFEVNLLDTKGLPYYNAVFFRDDPPAGPLSRADYLGDYQAYPENFFTVQLAYPFRIKSDTTDHGVLLENVVDGRTLRGHVSGDTLYTDEYHLDSVNVVKPLQAVLQTSFIKLNFQLAGPDYPASSPGSVRYRYCLKQ